MISPQIRRLKVLLAAPLLLSMPAAHAVSFSLQEGEVEGVLNTTLTYGAAWRMQDRHSSLVGKANNDPDGCNGINQSCQGLFKDQIYPSQVLFRTPGQYSMRNDDGNLNYDRHDMTQQVGKITQDLTLTYGDFGFFAKWLYFYDFTNNDFNEYHPNRITPENVGLVGSDINNPETADPDASNRYFEHTYGEGGVVRNKRRSGGILNQIGTDLQVLDFNVYGRVPFIGERELSFKIGRQTVNWGESTLLVVNSVNQAQPVNANNLYRVGFAVEEVFTPVGMAFLSTEPFANATIEAYYQYEWKPLEAPAPGSFLSFVDLGTYNTGDNPNLSFGSAAEDPDRAFRGDSADTQTGYLDNPLTLITPISATVQRLPDRNARDSGQFGLAFKYYAEELGSGTEFGLYFMNYHSKLPYVSFMSTDASCARREGNENGIDANNTASFLAACPNLPVLTNEMARMQLQADTLDLIQRNLTSSPQNLVPLLLELGVSPDTVPLLLGNPAALAAALGGLAVGGDSSATTMRDAVPLDSGKIFFEYPENLKMFGLSFNTSIGDYSIQGEVAYRPDAPLQVSIADLSFAAAGPTLTRCHDPNLGCAGSTTGVGFDENGNRILYGSSDFGGSFNDTINILLGHAPGSARAFPNYIIPYRGGVLGENAPNSYIRGYEEFDTFQFNLGFTQVFGATDNPFGADQIQFVGEFGATWVPDLPSLDVLQIDAPGVFTHASAGADGSGFRLRDPSQPFDATTNPYLPVGGYAQACTPDNVTCVMGPDGTRFNPRQADLDAFVDKFSWGYRLIAIVKYESVFPGISFQPFIIWAHDVNGTAPGPAENFVDGRKQALVNLETRYKSDLSFTVGYAWFTGGGASNLYRDRDFAQAYLKYQF
ncbi:MAG TPA: DUF1302 family protein [Solimonas sp.]|nr:DUF1302 family protein [Solimonas sp.]